ncbi:MAG: DEAD/DEAH box helicase [Bacteroidota bacterium]
MTGPGKEQMLQKLGITALNEMQLAAHEAIRSHADIVLLSPTGTGKTVAFLLPIIESVDPEKRQVQVLILVPSRELAIQIEQVLREMGTGLKVNAVYGGRSGTRDKIELKHPPAILIGTPGRVADHIRRENIATEGIKTLILDEFDKSLEIGFEDEMQEIVASLKQLQKKILTSATQKVPIPAFVGIQQPKRLNFLAGQSNRLQVRTLVSPDKDKLNSLADLLGQLGDARGIVFCNFKDSIRFVSEFLDKKGIQHTVFHGGLEQTDRERSLIMFRNGTHRILLATDLAARGIDVPELDFIIHYQLPPKKEEFTHRNGRTARMHREGTAYLLVWENGFVPDFIKDATELSVAPGHTPPRSSWTTLFVSGGRKDKISKGDIAGLFFKQGGLKKDELGVIELKADCAFVAVPIKLAPQLIRSLNNSRLKKKKVRISQLTD